LWQLRSFCTDQTTLGEAYISTRREKQNRKEQKRKKRKKTLFQSPGGRVLSQRQQPRKIEKPIQLKKYII